MYLWMYLLLNDVSSVCFSRVEPLSNEQIVEWDDI